MSFNVYQTSLVYPDGSSVATYFSAWREQLVLAIWDN